MLESVKTSFRPTPRKLTIWCKPGKLIWKQPIAEDHEGTVRSRQTGFWFIVGWMEKAQWGLFSRCRVFLWVWITSYWAVVQDAPSHTSILMDVNSVEMGNWAPRTPKLTLTIISWNEGCRREMDMLSLQDKYCCRNIKGKPAEDVGRPYILTGRLQTSHTSLKSECRTSTDHRWVFMVVPHPRLVCLLLYAKNIA